MQTDTVMVFAAGLGTRMGDLTHNCPKPLLKLADETLLDRTFALANDVGLSRHAVNTHYLGDMIERHLQGSRVIISREATELLDTGGGLRAAIPKLARDIVVTANPDVAWSGQNPFMTLLNAAQENADAVLLLYPATSLSRSGDFDMTADGSLRRGAGFVFTGVQIIRTASVLLETEQVFSLNRIWDRLIAQGRLKGVVYGGLWMDVGTPDGLRAAERRLSGSGDA